jgi:hypothetical protein
MGNVEGKKWDARRGGNAEKHGSTALEIIAGRSYQLDT